MGTYVTKVQLHFLEKQYISLGCWRDTKNWAINGYQGMLSVQGCYERALSKGFRVFGIQGGVPFATRGQCFTSATAGDTYNQYGRSNECISQGLGGPFCNDVYKIGIFVNFGEKTYS